MLRLRILVALVFLPLFAGIIFWSNPWALFACIGLGVVLAAVELEHLVQNRGLHFLGVGLPAILILVAGTLDPHWFSRFGIATFGDWFWLVVFLAFMAAGLVEIFKGNAQTGFLNVIATVTGVILLGSLASFLVRLRLLPHGSWWIALLFTFNWMYDAGALFMGMWLGRTPLSPEISPKKTVEGFVGGLLLNAVTGTALQMLLLPRGMGFSLMGIISLSMLLGALAQAGDLFESMIKRWSGLKDSAGLIPGHGGVLDKINSAIYTAPVLYGFARWMLGI